MFEKSINIGDLVKSTYHVGIGIIIDIVTPDQDAPPAVYRYEKEPMVMVYWFFTEPLEGKGWVNGVDYEYVARINVINHFD